MRLHRRSNNHHMPSDSMRRKQLERIYLHFSFSLCWKHTKEKTNIFESAKINFDCSFFSSWAKLKKKCRSGFTLFFFFNLKVQIFLFVILFVSTCFLSVFPSLCSFFLCALKFRSISAGKSFFGLTKRSFVRTCS